MSSPVEIADRMSENYDDKSVIALDDRLRDNVRESIRKASDATAECLSRALRASPTRRSLQSRLILPPSTHQFLLVLFTILVIVYSSTQPIIATVTSSTSTTRTLLLDTERAATTEAAHHHHHHHVEHNKPTTLANGGTSRGSNLNSEQEPEEERAKVSPPVRLPRTNIKINRTRRSSDILANGRQRTSLSSVNVCSDCLAIPMVALVGHKQVNGFLLHPAPANLQRHKSMASSSSTTSHYAPTTGSHTLSGGGQQSGDGINRARGVHDSYHDHNISHYGERTSQPASLIGQPVSSHGVPLSTHGAHHYNNNRADQAGHTRHASESHPTMNNRHYHQYQRVAYEQVVTSSPFEPKSDKKCPMTGPLTVCDQINSYPADAIVHRVAAAKRALHKAYFDIDSLFSDEGDGFTEPFGSTPAGAANSSSSSSSSGGDGGGIMMPVHPPEHDNMTTALDAAAHPAMRQHHAGAPGYYQATASTKAYQAYDQQTSSNGGGYSGEQQEQIEVNNQRAFAKRAHVSSPSSSPPAPALLEGGRGGSSGQSLDTSADARLSYAAAAHSSGVQRRQRSSSQSSLSRQQTNIGTPDDFLEHQTRPSRGDDSEEFLYLVERRGLSISGHHQMTVAAHREDSNPSDGGRGGVELGQHGSNLRQARQIMDQQQREEQDVGLLSLDTTDSAPSRSFVKSEIHKSKERPLAGQPSATVAGSTLNASTVSDTVAGTSDVLRSPGTILATTTLRLIPADIASKDDAQQWPVGKQTTTTTTTEAVLARASQGDEDDGGANLARDQRAPAAIGQTSNGQATTDTSRQRRDRLKGKFDRAADTREATLSTQTKFLDQTIKRADESKRPAAANDRLSSSARLLGGGSQQLRSASAIEHKSEQFVQLSHSSSKHPLRNRRGLAMAKSSSSHDEELAKIKLSHSDEQRQAGGQHRPAGLARSIDRFKRQVPPSPPIQVDRTPFSTTTTTTATNEELVDPERAGSTSVADDQAPAPQPICRAKSIYISPKAAMNHKKQWKYVVNAPERDPRIKQIIRVDICEAPFEPCSSEVTLPLGFTSQCKQKYAKKKLLALDARSGLLEVDTFFIPSCCVCQLMPASTRFSESPLSSSSPSAIDDDGSRPITNSRENNNDDDNDQSRPPERSPGSGAPASTDGDDSRTGGGGDMTAAGDSAGSSVNGDNVDNNGNASDNSNEGR